MLTRDGFGQEPAAEAWRPPYGSSHFAPRAKSVIWLFMEGGPSAVDIFDQHRLRVRRLTRPRRMAIDRAAVGLGKSTPGDETHLFRLVEENGNELAALESRDTGKPVRQGRADVTATMRYYEFYGGAGDKIHGDTIPFLDGYTALTLREPHGVVAGIIPWNYPLQILARVAGAALAMGNTLVVKPAEDASLTAIRMAELALEAGAVAVSEPLGAHPEVARTVLARYAVGAVELVPV
jgi:hypothetical protein